MHRRPYVLTGSAAAMLVAAAFAQPATTQPRRNGSSPSEPGRMYPLTNTANPKAMFNDLEGMWRVDMRINPQEWYHHADGMDRPGQTQMGTPPPGQPSSTTPPGSQTGNTPSNGGNPANNNDNRQPGATTNATPGPSGGEMVGGVSVQGYCEKRWLLGGSVLQESCLIPDLGDAMIPPTDPSSTRTGTTGQPGSPTRPSSTTPETRPSVDVMRADRMFQSITLLALDEASDRFDFVCMDTRKPGLHHSTGTFDAASNRIEFDIQDLSGTLGYDPTRYQPWAPTPSDRTGQPGQDSTRGATPHDPAHQPGTNATPPRNAGSPGSDPGNAPITQQPADRVNAIRDSTAHRGPQEGMHVVIEFLSPDQHRVTMYRRADNGTSEYQPSSGTGVPAYDPSRPTPAGTPNTTGDQPRTTGSQPTTTPGDPTRTDQPSSTGSDRPEFHAAYPTVIWQATYTRVDGADASRFRQYLRRADQLMQADVPDDRGTTGR